MPIPRAPSGADRIQQLKDERRRRTRIRVIALVVCTLLIIGGFVGASRIPKLQITRVVVRGNYIVSSDDVTASVNAILAKRYLWLIPKTNVFLYPHDKMASSLLAQFPRFQTVSIHRENWSMLIVEVTERKNTYLWCDTLPAAALAQNMVEHCFYVDSHGYIFAPAPTFSGNVYFSFFGSYGWNAGDAVINKRILDENRFRQIILFHEALTDHSLGNYGFEVNPDGTYAFLLAPSLDDSAQKIVFNTTQSIMTAYTDMISALGSQDFQTKVKNDFANLEYIDLRYDNKVYYKFSDGK